MLKVSRATRLGNDDQDDRVRAQPIVSGYGKFMNRESGLFASIHLRGTDRQQREREREKEEMVQN